MCRKYKDKVFFITNSQFNEELKWLQIVINLELQAMKNTLVKGSVFVPAAKQKEKRSNTNYSTLLVE